jgi:hypothetical protein
LRPWEHVISQNQFTYETAETMSAIDGWRAAGAALARCAGEYTSSRHRSNDTLDELYSAMAEDWAIVYFSRLKCEEYMAAFRESAADATRVVREQIARHESDYDAAIDEMTLAATSRLAFARARCDRRIGCALTSEPSATPKDEEDEQRR